MVEGARVLILEDHYYLATDLQAALQAAGAQVVGPFGDIGEASRALASDPPDCALVDLNLGAGISFDLPQRLRQHHVPFAFVTGYDRAAIPDEFAGFTQLEKPVAAQKVADVVQSLLAPQQS
ncbi:DNA-binding NtrC family response regulator [Sphingomonas jejuensis]|uniref:DNA-binding NtrC family response regulator n=1 Tax=Sphingomonas jejuensis TaxID=904715 RepID=A0ABX0XNL0_9SPHN|nr:response regulator [Sphingomonas jejuensis]NJC34281.1 DNA-binding NtrC family response regulator [Sphingomonas jejuensis]